ncbi:dihydroorotate dehydrogenase electron transfer subunit [Virgibacillus siamensis]|uniref:dihydroorotate dehydrogenase electron transfer subunit n=1 Tax=Virgibacillus siamensis TaxID=480071 RepID=UPI00098431CC|nr:dihydroorotate dehydrogenase electron transfer subunit [Virgibacillus siamensis]
MKKKVTMTVVHTREIAWETVEMTLENRYIAETAIPGQFLYLSVKGHTLRRPISIASIDREHHTATILFKKVGDGTKQLAAYQTGMAVSALGPSGNGFDYDSPKMKTALLIGGGIGVPPLYNLAVELKQQGIEVISVLGFQTKNYVFYEEKFQALGKTVVVTDDGSYGHKGFVTNHLPDENNFDYYFTCGPMPMLQAVTNALQDKPGSISLEERMGCGVGACLACVIPTDNKGGYRKICKDGPVFKASEVVL